MQGIKVFAAMFVAFVLCGTGIAFAAVEESSPSESSELPAQAAGVELLSKRTAFSDTFRLPSGALRTELFASPVNYETRDGEFKPIDGGLEEAPEGGITNGANSFDLHLPEQLGEGAVRLSDEGAWLSYRLLGSTSEPAEVEGSTASYESGSGPSFELHSLADGVKEEITLDNQLAPSSFRFALDLSTGLEATLEEDGSIEVEDGEGEHFATLPAPTIADAGGSPGAVHYVLQEGSEAGHWVLAVQADAAWLSDPQRVWPVTIDPSAFINTEQDCSIGSTPLPKGWTSCGAGGGTELISAYSQIAKEPVRTFLRFNLGTESPHHVLPTNAYISKALMKLYAPKAAENTVPGLEAKRVTQSWKTTLNWESYAVGGPGAGKWATPGGDFTSEGLAEVLTSKRGSGAGWWEFTSSSLRDLAQSWVEWKPLSPGGGEEGHKNQGLVVKQIDETRTAECESKGVCPRRYVGFNSSAAASNKPELDLNYFLKAPSTNKMTSPKQGTTTARRLMLTAAWAPGVIGVRFQYRASKKGPFTNIPSSLLRNAKGEAVEELAVSESCCQSEPLYFDAAHVTSELQSKGGVVQVRALFEGGTGAGFSEPVEAKVDRYVGGPKDESTQVGPGTLDLLTGNLSLSASDASIGGFSPLSFSRSYNTRSPGSTGEASALGQGWKPGVPIEEAGGSEWANLKLMSVSETIEGETYTFQYATVKSIQGEESAFEKVGEAYLAPPELTGYGLTVSEGRFVLTDPKGNKTTFGNENSGNGSEYLPISVTQPGSGSHATVMTWAFVNNERRLVREVAPTATTNPSSCAEHPTTTEGCRTLEFTYVPASNWGAPSGYGERLQKITFYAPKEGGPWEVAAYSYDTQGRLVSEWDPRISPKLETTYAYEGERLRKLTPPGEEPWSFEYAPNLDGETGPVSRLKAVKRSNLLGGETTTSIRYEVPISGSGAPYEMGGSSVAAWGQSDIPTDATAVFPPMQVPAEPASSYEKAIVYYMDSEGFGVNTATPAGAGTSGASISTTEADEFGNVTRELTPQNRLRALSDPEGKTVERSHLLEAKFTYSADGTELLVERGPLHQVKLQEGGEVAEARLQRTIAYENPEKLNPAPLVPTREVTGAIFPGKGTEADQRVTEYKYDWKLRELTEAITDAGIGHLNIKRKIRYYDGTGLPIETRQPRASEEGSEAPGVTQTIYYGDSGLKEETFQDPACLVKGNQKWAGLPCKTTPAAQPEGGPAVPITWFKFYNQLGEPTEIIEEAPGAGEAGVRTTVMTYDAAGRQTSKKIIGGGQVVSKVETLYSSTTGLRTTERFVCDSGECSGFDTQATTTTYDALGRVSSYEDADGGKSETTYDSFGRASTNTDSKGSQTLHYDAVTGLPTELTDSAAGTFTASYDADGNMVKRGLPNGLTAETTYDSTGTAVGLTYTKSSNCGASCTWLQFGLQDSIYGQILSETGTLKSDQYSYDRAGRLVEAQETPTGGNCTTRSYGYDKDSNRVSMTTIASSLGSGCGTGSSAEKKYSYDKADHLTDSGVAYDNFGRITKLPGVDAGGTELTTGYFSTDMVASQSQGGTTNTFELDASLRQRSRLQAGGFEGTEIFHYDDGSDSPAWTERGSTWTRNIVGVGGELLAIQESGSEVKLQLTNLHGDVVATAALNPTETKLLGTFRYDEFGNHSSGEAGRFGWLGGPQRRTELPAGIIQMGVRSYVPTIGRFTSVDPVMGGSANAYDYANQDPVNTTDLGGETTGRNQSGHCVGEIMLYSDYLNPEYNRGGYGKFHMHYWVQCGRTGMVVYVLKVTHYLERGGNVYYYHSAAPNNPASPYWNGKWGNWNQGRGTTYTCLYGGEYQYVYEFQYEWHAGVEGGGGSFRMSAHAICGREP